MKVKLGEICEIQAGGTPSRAKLEYWNGSIPWLKISDLKEKYIKNSEENITEIGLNSSNAKLFEKGTILFSIFATLGTVGILDIGATTNQAIAGIKVIDNAFYNEYIYYFLKSKKEFINNIGRGVAQNNINLSILKNLEIEKNTILFQKGIVNNIVKIEKLVDLYQSQLKRLDTLIKSRFVEMFGDNKCERKRLEDVSLNGGEYGASSASVEYDEKRPRYVRITDINDDGTLNDDYVCSINLEDDKNYKLEKGDFLFARMGATVGKTYVYKEGNQIFAGYLIRYKLKKDIMNPLFLYYYTKQDEYLNWVKLNQSGAAQPGINAKKYSGLMVPIPPIELQNDFASFVEQVDKSKFVIQEALNKTKMLMDSLMQEYFG